MFRVFRVTPLEEPNVSVSIRLSTRLKASPVVTDCVSVVPVLLPREIPLVSLVP